MPATVATYPEYEQQVQKLVKQHRKLKKEHLHLAVYLAPPKGAKRDVYLFEIIDDFGGGHTDPDKKLFTFAYGSTPGLPLPEGVRLWMILTNPTELALAIRDNLAKGRRNPCSAEGQKGVGRLCRHGRQKVLESIQMTLAQAWMH